MEYILLNTVFNYTFFSYKITVWFKITIVAEMVEHELGNVCASVQNDYWWQTKELQRIQNNYNNSL